MNRDEGEGPGTRVLSSAGKVTKRRSARKRNEGEWSRQESPARRVKSPGGKRKEVKRGRVLGNERKPNEGEWPGTRVPRSAGQITKRGIEMKRNEGEGKETKGK